MSFEKFLSKIEVPHENRQHVSILQNPDLEPMPKHRRIWGLWSYFAYWGIANISIGTFSVGAAFLSLGLNIQQAMGMLTVGNILVVLYTFLNSYPGQVYHIGYTLSQRMVFGIYGSSLGIVIRVILSIVNYGSQAWIGGLSMNIMFSCLSSNYLNMKNTFPLNVDMTRQGFISFLCFQIVQFPFFFIKPERMNWSLNFSCFICFGAFMSMWIYLMVINHGPGSLYHLKIELSSSELGWVWVYGFTTWYAGLSPSITNQPDFARFSSGSSQKLFWGIFLGIFGTELIPLAGMICASCSQDLYGTAYWMPTDIAMQWLKDDYSPRTRCACFFLGFAFMFTQLALNVLCNGFSGGMDLAAAFPRLIDIKRGAICVALLSWAVLPWKFYNSTSVFLSVMNSFGVIMTPITALIITDFIFIRKQRLKVNDLYTLDKNGAFYFNGGVNYRAIIVFFISIAPGIPGILYNVNPTKYKMNSGIIHFYDGYIVFSFVIPAGLYYVLAKYIWPIKGVEDYHDKDKFDAFTLEECKKLDLEPYNADSDSLNSYEMVEVLGIDSKARSEKLTAVLSKGEQEARSHLEAVESIQHMRAR